MDKATYTCENCDWSGTLYHKKEVPAEDGFGNILVCPICGHSTFFIEHPKEEIKDFTEQWLEKQEPEPFTQEWYERDTPSEVIEEHEIILEPKKRGPNKTNYLVPVEVPKIELPAAANPIVQIIEERHALAETNPHQRYKFACRQLDYYEKAGDRKKVNFWQAEVDSYLFNRFINTL